jgi:hypothetical protein
MRLLTIWTIPACSFQERLSRTRDWAAMKIGSHLPQRVKFWVTIQELGHATATSQEVPATTLTEILAGLRTPGNLS